MTGMDLVPRQWGRESSPTAGDVTLEASVNTSDGLDTPVSWTSARALLDWLRHHPERVSATIARAPSPSIADYKRNLLAGIAEKLADDSGLPRPSWTADVSPDGAGWAHPGTPLMQSRWEAATPPQLATRHIILAAESLWRPTIA